MSRRTARKKNAGDDAPVAVDPGTAAELRRIANLFLITALTLVAFLARAAAEVLTVTFIPREAYVIWGGLMLFGWILSLLYGVFVTLQARRWGWFLLCLFPPSSVPAGLAYSWTRRQEIEQTVLPAQDGSAPAPRTGKRSR